MNAVDYEVTAFSTGLARSIALVLPLQGATTPLRQQSSSDHVQIGQRKQGEDARGILLQATVTHLGEAPQLFDHAESELTPGAPPRAAAIDGLVMLAQRPMGLGPTVDPIVDARTAAVQAMILAPVSLIAVELVLLTMQQVVQAGNVRFVGRSGGDAMHQALLAGADVHLHAEVPLLVFLGLVHFQITRLRFVLGRTGRADDRR